MNIRLRQLRIFVLVFEQGSFNKAADVVRLTQSAVSQQMKQLEGALGTVLFERTPHGAIPTAAAQTLYEYATQILRLLAEAEAAVSQLNQLQNQTLTVGATAGISVYLLPGWLKRFQTEYPKVNLSVKTAKTEPLLDALRRREVAFAFFVDDMKDLETTGLARRELDEVEYFVVMNATHPWRDQEAIGLAQLQDASFLNRQPPSRYRRWLEREMAALGVRLNTAAELENPGVIKYALLSELGISILPEYAVVREVARGELLAKRLETGRLKRPLLLVWEEKRPFQPVQRAFLRSLDGML